MAQKLETIALHEGQEVDPVQVQDQFLFIRQLVLFSKILIMAKLFALKEFGNIYTRIMNPTTDVLEKRCAALEGGKAALCTASGMSAIFLAVHTILSAGDHIIASASLYGGTDTMFRYSLPKMGITVDFVEDLTAEKIAPLVKDNTKLVYFETYGNPKGDVLDIQAVCDEAHRHNIPVMVDNTFAPGLFGCLIMV